MPDIPFVFFGTDTFATVVLDTLSEEGRVPSLIVSTPDTPQGRKLLLTPPPVKVWAQNRGIPCIQPEKLKLPEIVSRLASEHSEVFIVASYGKIIPKEILAIPTRGTLNIHPSLLPKYRGPSPIQSQILAGEKEVGVTIMLLDEEMDHGPIIAQEKVELPSELAQIGAKLLAQILPSFISGELQPVAQDHTQATYTKKITKKDGMIDLNADPILNYRKFLAFGHWPRTYFFAEHHGKKIRVIITEALFEDDNFKILKVIPEGKREMTYEEFCRSMH